jgi:hypothetical protein
MQQTLSILHVPHDVQLPPSRQVLLARRDVPDASLEEGSPDHLGASLDMAEANEAPIGPLPRPNRARLGHRLFRRADARSCGSSPAKNAAQRHASSPARLHLQYRDPRIRHRRNCRRAERWCSTWKREGSRCHRSSARTCVAPWKRRRMRDLTWTPSAAAWRANNRLSRARTWRRDRGLRGAVRAISF